MIFYVISNDTFMANILLYGYFGHKNLGDDLLFCEALKKIPSKYEIYVDAVPEVAPNLEEYRRIRDFHIINGRRETLSRRYDMLIYGGGGLFPYRAYSFKSLFYWFTVTATCRRKVFNGIGIVPKPQSPAFAVLLKCLSWCSVRDNVSLEFCKKYRKQVVNCGDLYFGNEHHYINHPQKTKKCIVSIAYPFYANEIIKPDIKRRYNLLVENIAEAVATIKAKGYDIEYLPFFIGRDEPMIANIQEKIGSQDKVLERGVDYTLDKIDQLFGSFSLALSMRFHSILLAVKNAVPVIPISYDYKSEELLKEAGLIEYSTRYGIAKNRCFGIEKDLDMEGLNRSIERVISDKDDIMKKQINFYQKKYEQVIDNYRNIFGKDYK